MHAHARTHARARAHTHTHTQSVGRGDGQGCEKPGKETSRVEGSTVSVFNTWHWKDDPALYSRDYLLTAGPLCCLKNDWNSWLLALWGENSYYRKKITMHHHTPECTFFWGWWCSFLGFFFFFFFSPSNTHKIRRTWLKTFKKIGEAGAVFLFLC